MKDFMVEYKLSLYESLIILSESYKTKVELVRSTFDGIVYIKKTMKNYNIEVYKLLKDIDYINLPKIYEIIEYSNELIIIEEFINGENLEDILKNKGVLEEDKAIGYIIKLCNALSRLHFLDKPVIHRDIKPSNVIIDRYGVIKLIDFDASRVYKHDGNKDTEVLGTHGYAAPEQFVSLQTDGRSDIYSLGVLFNMLLVGKDPREEITNSKVKSIIEKCINLDPRNRYQSVIELKDDLKKLKYSTKDNIKNKEITYENVRANKSDKPLKNNEKPVGKLKSIIMQIPGFRSGKKLKATIAIIWYLFLLSGILASGGPANMNLFIDNSTVVVMLLSYWLLGTNFKNIHSKLPLLKDKSIVKKIVGYILYFFIIFLIGGLTL